MSTRRCLWALACICTSAVAAAGPTPAASEVELARRPGLYLLLDVAQGTLEIKARGMEFDRVPVRRVELRVPRSPAERARPIELELPVAWRVAREPEEEWRQVVAPPTLVPYREEELPPVPAATATPEPQRPSHYQVELDNGWRLEVGPSPPTGIFRRLLARLSSGWQRLLGHPVAPGPPTVAVRTSAEDARRLLHVFRRGVAILVVDGADAGPPAPIG